MVGLIRVGRIGKLGGISDAADGGAPSFDPLTLSPKAWYDISDTSTLWQDTAATVAVMADSDPVARVDDKSGNGNHLVQATTSKRPLYKTASGKHWLLFDGTDDFLSVSFSSAATIARVSGLEIVTQTNAARIFDVSAALLYRGDVYLGASAGSIFAHGYVGVSVGNVGGTGVPFVMSDEWAAAGTRFAINAGSWVTSSAAQAQNGFFVGSRGDGVAQFSRVKWFGSVLVPTIPSATDYTNLRTFIAGKSGVTL